jgi:superfamily II DNA/RNA helicase
MVASGVASKGLDFNDIQHVIIFSMPKEIEDYVHQIGRTGRSGKTGIATTFVNMNTPGANTARSKISTDGGRAKVRPSARSCTSMFSDATCQGYPHFFGEDRGSPRRSRQRAQRVSGLWR